MNAAESRVDKGSSMELRFGLISVDDHVQEHPEVWTARLSKAKWGDRAPHIQTQPDGTERWVIDGKLIPLAGTALAGALMSDRVCEPQRWEETPPAAFDPNARLQAMDTDGVDYSVLYPTVAGPGGDTLARFADPDLELACVQAYNDWLIDEWAAVSPRFIPQCLTPVWPIEAAVAEIRRAVARGHRGVIYPAVPMELRDVPHVNEPDYDPLWSVCEELGVPLCFHAGSSANILVPVPSSFSPALAAAFEAITRPASTIAILVHVLISRILMRHPKLKVVFAESSLGWGGYQVEFADQQFREDGLTQEGYELSPSQLFQRQCFLTGWYDDAALVTRHIIGVDNIMWSTNFPHATSTWPRSQDHIKRAFAQIPQDERVAMLWGNAAKLYQI